MRCFGRYSEHVLAIAAGVGGQLALAADHGTPLGSGVANGVYAIAVQQFTAAKKITQHLFQGPLHAIQ